VNLADLYRSMNREQDAEQVLREGLEINTEAAALYHSLGLLLVRGEQQETALLELEKATKLAPDNSRFAYVYAVALNSLGQVDNSIAAMLSAANRFPANFDIQWALVSMLRDQGRIAEAKAVAEDLSRQYPEDQNVQALLQSL
jgi:Flp pilus assembly protein TadD